MRQRGKELADSHGQPVVGVVVALRKHRSAGLHALLYSGKQGERQHGGYPPSQALGKSLARGVWDVPDN